MPRAANSSTANSTANSSAANSSGASSSAASSSVTLPSATESLQRIRHSCSHILAMAVQRLFPETQVTLGPWTETGFYYDFDRPTAFTPEDLVQIEVEMRRIIKADLPIIREVVERSEIRAEIERLNEPYKLEILESIPADAVITRYFIGCPDVGRPYFLSA